MAYMITTVDNPFDPRTDFGAWYMWDTGQGYNTSAYLARIAAVAEDLPDVVQDRQVEEAIDEIIEMHSGGMYKKLPIDEDSTVQPVPTPSPSAA